MTARISLIVEKRALIERPYSSVPNATHSPMELVKMKRPLLIALLILAFSTRAAFAQRKNCEELKSEIAAKLDAKGVKNYELKIVSPEEVKDETVVGSC